MNADSIELILVLLTAWLEKLQILLDTHLPDEFQAAKSSAKLYALTAEIELTALRVVVLQGRFEEISPRLALISNDLSKIEENLGVYQGLLENFDKKWVRQVRMDVFRLLD